VSKNVTTTMSIFPRIPDWASRGDVHAGLLAESRVRC
jgi:hypothetical protein